jgi:ribonucleoside-diphosphate reductase alpha chain
MKRCGYLTLVTKDRKSHIQKTEFSEERFSKFVDEIVNDSDIKFNTNTIKKIKSKVIDYVNTKSEVEADKLFDLNY